MTRNMGTIDRAVRGLVAAPLALVAALAIGAGSIAGVVLLGIAAVMLATAVVGFCPLYALFGIRTGERGPVAHG